MKINTLIKKIEVEIDGVLYQVAPKTIEIVDKLKDVDKKSIGIKLEYEQWLDAMKVLLGEPAVSEIFSNGNGENLDRIENIYYGVMYAFEQNADRLKTDREKAEYSQVSNQLQKLNKQLEPINKTLDRVKNLETANKTTNNFNN